MKEWGSRASTSAPLLLSWWDRWPNANVGLVTGPKSGVLALDIDPRNGGGSSLQAWEFVNGPLPPTVTAESGSGGSHYLFRWPLAAVLRGGKLPALRGYDGIDTQGAGRLLILAPSLHASGGRYRWLRDPGAVPLAELPTCLLDQVPLLAPEATGDPYLDAVIESEVRHVAEAVQGARNGTLFRSACRLGALVEGGGLGKEQAEHELLAAAPTGDDFSEAEALSTIRSGLLAGAKTPRPIERAFTSRGDALAFLDEVEHIVKQLRWKGHRGKRTHDVLTAMVSIARYSGGTRFRATTKGIALEMGSMNLGRVTKGLGELIEDGWLTRLKRGRPGHASEWRLRLPPVVERNRNKITPLKSLITTMQQASVPIGHDAFRTGPLRSSDDRFARAVLDCTDPLDYRGLGSTRWRIFTFLSEHPGWHPQTRIATSLGIHRSTVGRNRERLLELGLISKDRQGALRANDVTEQDLQRVADHLRTSGAQRAQRRRYGWDTDDAD